MIVLMLGGIIEFGHVWLVRAQMTDAAREGVRRLAVEALTESEVKTFVSDRVGRVTNATVTVTITSVEIPSSDRNDLTVTVDVPLEQVSIINLDAFLGGKGDTSGTLTAAATMISE